MSKVQVNDKGIKNRLKAYKPFRSIAEYIWNGFDAGANEINIEYRTSILGSITFLCIRDNGAGIPLSQLGNKFEPVLSSEKRDKEIQHTLIHGKNGLGRLTFYHFCQYATWSTYYQKDQDTYTYDIRLNADRLDHYDPTGSTKVKGKEIGTSVKFENILELTESELLGTIRGYLAKEFAWFLELNKNKGFSIKMNGKPLAYEHLIREKNDLELSIDSLEFKVTYLRWSNKLNNHFSRIYCLDNDSVFKYTKPTTFNNKGDEFYHSVMVSSVFFDNFSCCGIDSQDNLFDQNSDKSEIFKKLLEKIETFLMGKRKPFLVEFAKSLVDEYEKLGIFPIYNSKNRWEEIRSQDLKETVRQLYEIDPRIFSNLNKTQKKTFVGFLALIVDNGEVNDIFKILEGIIELSSVERARFANQLKTTKLSSVIQTIELISDRYKSVEEFKKLVFDHSMYAGEVPHLQKMMEKNYWLIGEEYQLLTAAEPDFEEALRRYSFHLHGDDTKKKIDHEDKNKEMDIFLIRQTKRSNKIENVIIELKHPINVRLGKPQIDQIYTYYQVISSESRFNGSNSEWKFYLIGNKFDSTDYIDSQINSLKHHGEPGLVFTGKYKVYAFKWSEIFNEFELRHDFLNQKLMLERDRLAVSEYESADDITTKKRSSDSIREIIIPVSTARTKEEKATGLI